MLMTSLQSKDVTRLAQLLPPRSTTLAAIRNRSAASANPQVLASSLDGCRDGRRLPCCVVVVVVTMVMVVVVVGFDWPVELNVDCCAVDAAVVHTTVPVRCTTGSVVDPLDATPAQDGAVGLATVGLIIDGGGEVPDEGGETTARTGGVPRSGGTVAAASDDEEAPTTNWTTGTEELTFVGKCADDVASNRTAGPGARTTCWRSRPDDLVCVTAGSWTSWTRPPSTADCSRKTWPGLLLDEPAAAAITGGLFPAAPTSRATELDKLETLGGLWTTDTAAVSTAMLEVVVMGVCSAADVARPRSVRRGRAGIGAFMTDVVRVLFRTARDLDCGMIT